MRKNSRLDQFLDRTLIFSFTSVGYDLRKSNFRPIPRIDGQRVVVTGATSGLGMVAARQLAELGASVALVGRNAEKAERVRDEIRDTTGNNNVSFELADLSLMTETAALAERLVAGPPIDVLINNAGVLVGERAETNEGIELTLATNLLSHYLLTESVAEHIVDGGRIINVSSGGMYSQRIRPDDIQFERGEYTGTAAYARTKRGQVILTEIWANEFASRGITVSAMHPGWADTPGVSDSLPTFSKIIGPILRTPEEGADTMVWLAATDEPVPSGKFWLDRTPRTTHMTDRTKERPEDRVALVEALKTLSASNLS
jgi:dehydrogenase/reductase SDR family protein 12